MRDWCCLLGRLHPVQKPDVGVGESVGSRTFPQQRDIAQRRLTIDFFARRHVGDGWDHPTITVFGLNRNMTVTAPGYSFRRIQADQIPFRYAVEHAPNFRVGVRVEVCRSSLATWSPIEIEA